jgi:formate-dependent nitrite reductase membrane component NrfD
METTASSEGLLGLAFVIGLSGIALVIVILRMAGVRWRRRRRA